MDESPQLIPLDISDIDEAIFTEIYALSKIQEQTQALLQKTNEILTTNSTVYRKEEEIPTVYKKEEENPPNTEKNTKKNTNSGSRFSTLQKRLSDFLQDTDSE